jgi:hypothetical protein
MGSPHPPPTTLTILKLTHAFLNKHQSDQMTLTIQDIIGCSSLGFYCITCKRSLQMANVKTHLERLHKSFFLTMTRKELKDSIDSMRSLAGNAPIEECLIGSTQKGVVCSICKEFFLSTRPAIFTRHISNRQQKCQDAIALNVSYRNTACFRQHITQQSP